MEREEEIEKLNYMHKNPVKRGLAAAPQLWLWSSYRFYQYGERMRVRRIGNPGKSTIRRAWYRSVQTRTLACGGECGTRKFNGVRLGGVEGCATRHKR